MFVQIEITLIFAKLTVVICEFEYLQLKKEKEKLKKKKKIEKE